MLKKLGLAAAAAVGLSLIATPAFATPAADAASPAASSCAGDIARAPELPDAAAADEGIPMEAADAAAVPEPAVAPEAAAAQSGAPFAIPGFPGFFCIPRPAPQCASASQQSFPWPIPGRTPCSSSFSSFPRPHFLGGGLSALLDACLDLNLGLNVGLHGRPFSGGSCHSWSPC